MGESEALYIDYGSTRIPFLLTYGNRKTLGISVTPDKQVTITAPLGVTLQKILEKIGKRAGWISKQMRRFELYEQAFLHRKLECVNGETLFYLGRKYRLKVLESMEETVHLQGRYLKIAVNKKAKKERIAGLLMDWYKREAKKIFHERFERYQYILKRERISVNQLIVRKLEKRWGSCTENGNIILNMSLVQAPVQCIDYVLVHEICHLKYLDHGAKFHRLLLKYVEDWEKRREKLQLIGLLDHK